MDQYITTEHHNNKKPAKVGIIVVSYNAADAVILTLSSIKLAKNHTPYRVFLVDNASNDIDREKIRTAFNRYHSELGDSWKYIQSDKNLGFSGGNNKGIKEAINDEEITHFCLLNSDVIVTDCWLDRLIEKQCDIISAVTNKADSEQCIPVDYTIDFSKCLDTSGEIRKTVHDQITDFANRWYHAWHGNLVETDVTFFCVIISRIALNRIGFLDETFYPGGFEDDDYCLRAIESGYKIYLARDVFIHHWGSASFGRLQYEYLNKNAQQNKNYLEQKHNFIWKRRPEKPFVSFQMDVAYTISNKEELSSKEYFLNLYIENLTRLLESYELEFHRLSQESSTYQIKEDDALKKLLSQASSFTDLRTQWKKALSDIKILIHQDSKTDISSTYKELPLIIKNIHNIADTNINLHTFLVTQREKFESSQRHFLNRLKSRSKKIYLFLKKGIRFLIDFNGIIFFGGYFYPERQSDGYFQRIQMIDQLFSDQCRLYVESEELPGRNFLFDRPENKVFVLRLSGSKIRRIILRIFVFLTAIRCRKIYFHSILRMKDNQFGKLLHLPMIKNIVDIHGAVPEEFRMHQDFFSGMIYDQEEKLAVEKADKIIVVSNAMTQYLQQKFHKPLTTTRTILYPMFPNFQVTQTDRKYIDNKPVVVYAGGLHKWQQVPKMIHAMINTADHCTHLFFCPEPQTVKKMLPPSIAEKVIVDTKSHDELMATYAECHYGFILREDSIVNRVACPTKLVEYIASGIVPIIDSDEIGDFKQYGMQYVCFDDFLAGRLPIETQRSQMAANNLDIYQQLKQIQQKGSRQIHEFFTQ